MDLVSNTPEFKELLSRLERIALEVGSSNSLEVYSGGIGPVPMDGLPVHDKGYHGKLFRDPSNPRGYLILVDLDEGREVLCDVAPATPHYITFRKDNQLVAVIEHRPFLDDLYVNEMLKQTREKGERIIGDPNDVEVTLPILYIMDNKLFQQETTLDAVLRNEFGYSLDIKYDANFQFPQTIETPPIALGRDLKKFNEKWETGEGWEKLKITAIVYEAPIKAV